MPHGEQLSRRTVLKLTVAATATVSGCNFFDSDDERSATRTTVGYGSAPAGNDTGTSIGTGSSRSGRSTASNDAGTGNPADDTGDVVDDGDGANSDGSGASGGLHAPDSESTDRDVFTPDSGLATLTEIGTVTAPETETPTPTSTATETPTEPPVSTTEAPQLYNVPNSDDDEDPVVSTPTQTPTATQTVTETATGTQTTTETATPGDDYGDVGYGQLPYGSPTEQ